jgi:putative tryptophan/tyrosine transport system ATP-binding protein
MIRVENVSVTFNAGTPLAHLALDDLSFFMPSGQFVTVIGSNGAGKSTLLNLLSGELAADSGSVSIDGVDVTTVPVHRRAKWVSRVFQDPLAGTCNALTVEENLALASCRASARNLRLALDRPLREMCRARLAQARLGLENRLGDRIGLLSGGQRQVVSLVMAALVPMRILLLDEHTAALDPLTAETVLQLTQTLIDEAGLTALMVTHSMRQALRFGQRTIMLHQGRVALDLPAEERAGLGVQDLLAKFEHASRAEVSDDALLLG